MKKKVSITLVVVLVLVAMMAVCLVGCGPKTKVSKEMQEALKGVDVKDGKAVFGVVTDAIKNKNVTITMSNDYDGAKMGITIKYDGKKSEATQEMTRDGKTQKFGSLGVEKDGKVKTYTFMDGKWEAGEEGSLTIDQFNQQYSEFIPMEILKGAKYEYNKKDNNFTGNYKDEGIDINIVMSIVENGIEFKMSDESQSATILVSNIGSTKVEVPTVA